MSNELLAGRYDAALLDLDGTIYEGGRAVPGALEGLTEAGLPMLFVTNNASRAPETVAEQLRSLGYDCDADDVMTSAQAAIEMAADIIPEGSKVLILGAQWGESLATLFCVLFGRRPPAPPLRCLLSAIDVSLPWRTSLCSAHGTSPRRALPRGRLSRRRTAQSNVHGH